MPNWMNSMFAIAMGLAGCSAGAEPRDGGQDAADGAEARDGGQDAAPMWQVCNFLPLEDGGTSVPDGSCPLGCRAPSVPWPCRELAVLTFEPNATGGIGRCIGAGTVPAAPGQEIQLYIPGFAFDSGYVYSLDVTFSLPDDVDAEASGRVGGFAGLDRGLRYTLPATHGLYRVNVRVDREDATLCTGEVTIDAR